MNRAWIICALLASGTHAFLLFAIDPGGSAEPRALDEEFSAVEVSIVEAAPAATSLPVEPEPVEPEPPIPPAPEPLPPEPPPPEPEPEPKPEPAILKPTPPPRRQPDVTKPRAVSPQRAPVANPATTESISGAASRAGSNRAQNTSARPRYRSNPKPDYPAEARRAGQQGIVMIAVEVTADGRAGSVRLSRSSGFPLLDASALQAVRRWTFEPARTLGVATASRVEVPVRFNLDQ